MDAANLAVGISMVLGVGAVCTAIWSILRLNSTVKDKGREEQRILDRLEYLMKCQGENANRFDTITVEIGLVRTLMEEFKIENQTQHHELEKAFTTRGHELEKRIQQLELSGCKPSKNTG